jgi:hypothetical protein
MKTLDLTIDYKIFEGYDHYNQKPLYRVEGIKNDYVGEWHKVDFKAFAELVELVS